MILIIILQELQKGFEMKVIFLNVALHVFSYPKYIRSLKIDINKLKVFKFLAYT